ncbi:hypothetical protein SSX86_014375 [Deinandra increscens subsp. villosa]|uniref:BHLH domain-containing protein n=1 Tax=Deinandra increscens subsp. villosa TaxID=3103831 RepID=A0AAP0GZB9_9ASTR
MKSRDEIHHHYQQQQLQQPSAAAAPPPNLMAHHVQVQASSSVDYDPDSESECYSNVTLKRSDNFFFFHVPKEGFEHLMEEMVAKPNPNPPRNPSKRARAAEVHNMSEKRRRSRINEKMKALQKLIPNSNKTDKASMLDEAIEYLKQLQLQVQMLTMRNGINLYSVYQPNQRASGMNYVNPMLNQNQQSILDFSPTINQDPSF